MATCNFKTIDGDAVQFYVYPAKDARNWADKPGLYIFGSYTQTGSILAHYIGQASSLKDRLANHERWDEAENLGADLILARIEPTQSGRDSKERDLIENYKPKLNTHFKR